MKTTNFWKYTASILAVSVVTSLVACGNKNQNNNNPQPVYGFEQCVNCQGINGAAFFTAQSTDTYGSFALNWSFTGQAAGAIPQQQYNPYQQQYNPYQQQYNPYQQQQYSPNPYVNQYSPMSYSGLVGVVGQLAVNQGMNLGYCQLPGGNYNLGTLSAGQWTMGIVYNLRMQATGPANIVLTLTQGQVSSPGYLQPGQMGSGVNPNGRLFANVMIESVNGQPCQTSMLVQ